MTQIRLTGFKELEKALVEELPKATARAVLRRTGIAAMARLEERARQLAPRDDGALAASITTKPVKARRQGRARFAAASGVTVATGPTGRPEGGNAAWQENGTVNMPANPYMRPAAAEEGEAVIGEVRDKLAAEIDKTRARIARKLAKRGG